MFHSTWGTDLFATVLCTGLLACHPAVESKPLTAKGEVAEYHFTTDWFAQNAPVWTEVLRVYQGTPEIRYLEIGTFEGRSFFWMLDNVLTHPTSQAVGIDLFPGDVRTLFDANLAASGHHERVTTIAGDSKLVLRQLEPNSFDIIYVDGSHAAKDVLTDAVLSWILLRNGGVLILDDYNWQVDWPLEFRPRTSIDAFLTVFRNDLEVLIRQDQVIVRKVEMSQPYVLRLGDHAFLWRLGELVEIGVQGSSVPTADQLTVIERLAQSRGFGQTDFELGPESVPESELRSALPNIQLDSSAPRE